MKSLLQMIMVLSCSTVTVLILAMGTEAAGQTATEPGMTVEQFHQEVSALDSGDLDGRIRLADVAGQLGRIDDADELYRQVLAIDPAHALAYNALWALRRGAPIPKESGAYTDARQRLPDTFLESTTSRYVIFSDADPKWVLVQGRRLERARNRFIRFTTSLGLRPLPLRHKLVAIVFDDRKNFAAFAGPDGNKNLARVAGYYSPSADRLVFYHVESNANIAAARADLESMAASIDDMQRQSRRMRSANEQAERQRLEDEVAARLDHLDAQERRINQFAIQQSVSVTVHEAIHQLMFHTGLQSPRAPHPLWIVEGLATAFETDDTRSSFGPLREYAPRRTAFYHMLDNGQLLSLRDLVGLQPANMNGNRRIESAVYNQGYAIVSWLCRHRKQQLGDYLKRLNVLPPIPLTAEDHVDLFEQSFGDIDRVEKQWLKDEVE